MPEKNYSTLWLILFYTVVINLHGGDSPEVPSEPEILSIFPLGGRQGSSFQVEIRGQALAGARGVWFVNRIVIQFWCLRLESR